MNTTHIAVDLAKSVFQLAVSHSPGKVAEEHRLPRTRFRNFFLHRPPSHVLMEACGSAHHWGRELEAKANGLKDQLQRLGSQIPTVQYLLTVPGIGTLSAKALFSTVGDIHRFRSGRSLANYLGLTPRESSSGLRRRMGRISKRGDTYTRMLLVHGARSALLAAHRVKEPDQLQARAIRTAKARGHNIATVALANRIARIPWRVWRDQRPFQRCPRVQEVPA